MTKLKLNRGFYDIPVGKQKLLQIKTVAFDKKNGTTRVTFKDEKGGTLTEYYKTYIKKRNKFEPNDTVLSIFSGLAKKVLHLDPDLDDFDLDISDLEGRYIIADVTENTVETKDEETGEVTGSKTYRHVRNFVELNEEQEEELGVEPYVPDFDDAENGDGEGFDDEDDDEFDDPYED